MITDILRCPKCKGKVAVRGNSGFCDPCQWIWSVRRGAVRFVSTIDEGFNERWVRNPKPQATVAGIIEQKTGWNAKDLAGKVVLDAGCGCGRFSQVAASWGAQVVSVDGSSAAVEATAKLVPGATVIQADLLVLPLADQSVDMAFSIGVLHHTLDPQAAFNEVARTVKVGGQLAVWLYVAPGGDAERLVADPVVSTAAKFLHEITRACPPDALYEVCEKYSILLRDLYSGSWEPLQQVLRVSGSKDDSECVSDTFDWHCPQYRSGHTNREVVQWFEQAGFKVDRIGDFPVSVRGIKHG